MRPPMAFASALSSTTTRRRLIVVFTAMSVRHGHLRLDSTEELVEIDPEMLEEHGECGDRRRDAAAFHGTHEGSREWRRHGGLAQLGGASPAAELSADSVRQPLFLCCELINS
jgi:hypothetical protein